MSARSLDISRRRFIASAGLAATAVCLVPHRVFGDEENNGESFTKLVYKGVGKDSAHLPNHL